MKRIDANHHVILTKARPPSLDELQQQLNDVHLVYCNN